MARLELLPYECITCHKIFMSYFEVLTTADKEFVESFNESDIVFKQIKNERKCKRCRYHIELTEFGLHI